MIPSDRELNMRELYDALVDIEELVEDKADVDDGKPNLAMKVLVLVRAALNP